MERLHAGKLLEKKNWNTIMSNGFIFEGHDSVKYFITRVVIEENGVRNSFG